jgi:hypothetical protein
VVPAVVEEDYVPAIGVGEVQILVKLYVETHLTHVVGGGPATVKMTLRKMKDKFASMKQEERETVGQFKERYDELVAALEGAGVQEMDDDESALCFLTKLDQKRFGVMNQLGNDATCGKEYPQTLHEAWTVASSWKTEVLPILTMVMMVLMKKNILLLSNCSN